MKTVLFHVYVFLTFFSHSQTTVTGTVKDQSDSVLLGNVLLLSQSDSSLIAGNYFDFGKFSIESNLSTPALLKISSYGFEDTIIAISSEDFGGDIDLGVIRMKPAVNELGDVEVTALLPLFTKSPEGGLVVNVQKTMLGSSTSILEVLSKSPNVTINGSTISVIERGETLLYKNGKRITETTVNVTYKEVGAADIEANKSIIGVPIPTLSCFVLDEDLQLCAPGVNGELSVGGAGVARGYHNKPELTAEKFVANTISNVGKLYRSGDFARLLENGDIEYIGRKDEQVKIRGHRIELPEVEEGLKRLTEVDDAVVLAKKNKADEFELIAYYILMEENAEVNLREELSKGLPSYMIPSHYIALKSFPMTSNGKLDKKALPKVSRMGSASSEYIAPENEIQSTIVGIWEEILDKENIGIRDNFFDLGGHSLKATRVISKIQEVYGVKIDLGSLFIDPTVASLSEHVSTLVWMSKEENVESDGEELII